jgi:ubiquinone/menaquinone biosynthesis C-methylase UbiE
VRRYYDRTESRWGYEYILGGTKHYGWYDDGDPAWPFGRALSKMEDQLAARLRLPAGSTVLDAGCGTGAVARALARRHGLDLTGIDILDWNIERATYRAMKEGLSNRTQFFIGDYHKLDFPDEAFDGVFTMETLVHAVDPDRVLSEFFRVLRPGGRIVHFEYSHNPKEAVSDEAWAAFEKVCELAVMPAWLEFGPGVLDKKLDKAGFRDIKTADITAHMLPMLKVFYRLGRFPYYVGRRIGKVEKTVNAMSGVEMYKHRSVWRYNITEASRTA